MSKEDAVDNGYVYNEKGALINIRDDFLKQDSMLSVGEEIGGALGLLNNYKWNPEIAFLVLEASNGRFCSEAYRPLGNLLEELLKEKLAKLPEPNLTEGEKAAALVKFLEYQNNDKDGYSYTMDKHEKTTLYKRIISDGLSLP